MTATAIDSNVQGDRQGLTRLPSHRPWWPSVPRPGQWFRAALSLWVWWGLLLVWPAQALELRVMVREGGQTLTLGTSETGTLRTLQGDAIATTAPGRSLTAQLSRTQVQIGSQQAPGFWVDPGPSGYVFIGDRWYRGRALVRAEGNGLLAVNHVDLEAYLYSVVGGEMPSRWPLEALKAQAVAARTYVLYHQQRSRHPHFDVGGTTAWQVYRGLGDEAPSTRLAVSQTEGQVLTYNGQLVEAVFHSASGGHTENVEDIWSQPRPYLRGVQDFDAGSPVFEWTVAFPMAEFSRRVGGIGTLTAAQADRLTPRGRVVEMRLAGNQGIRTLTGGQMRQALGLRSTLFTLIPQGDTVVIQGRGFGHGVGMSQWGAHNLAQTGRNYSQILAHYYQGTQLARLTPRAAAEPPQTNPTGVR